MLAMQLDLWIWISIYIYIYIYNEIKSTNVKLFHHILI